LFEKQSKPIRKTFADELICWVSVAWTAPSQFSPELRLRF